MSECANPKCESYSETATTCCCRKCSNNLNSIRNAEKRRIEREERQRQFFLDNPQPKCANPDCNNLCYFRERYWKWSVCCSNSCVTKYTQFIAKQDTDKYREKMDRVQLTRKNNYALLSEDAKNQRNTEIHEKRSDTLFKKYGTTNLQEVSDVQNKRKLTLLDRYGVENPFASAVVQEKIEKTMLERYGVIRPLQNKHIKEKQKSTNLERYGVEESGGLFLEQSIQTCREKYGTDFYMQTEESKIRRNNTMVSKYGGLSSAYENYTDVGRELMKPENFQQLLKLNEEMTLTEIAYIHGMSLGALVQRFSAHGVEPKIHYTSLFHKQIVNFLKTECYISSINENDRTIISPREIDIVIHAKNIGIECNGIFWHSERQLLETRHIKDVKNYHLQKTVKCTEKGISLLHIWQHMWDEKNSICKSIIKARLGMFDRVEYGRHAKIKLVGSEEEYKFLNENHIQGYVSSDVCIGLYSKDDELLSLMSFCKSRYSKKYQYELLRFCHKTFTTVVGGAKKLFTHFLTNFCPNSVVSYCHIHLFSGDLYKTLGFCFSHRSAPSYWYTKDYRKLHNRQKFQKHKLANLLEHFNPDMSEWENMKMNNWDRIWDCGNDVYVWRR